MDWLGLLPALSTGLAILVVPGLLVVLAARVRGFDAVALAPAVSVAVVAVSAIVAPLLGLGWALWIPFVAGAGTAVVVGLLVRFLRRLGLEDFPEPSPRTPHGPGSPAGADPVPSPAAEEGQEEHRGRMLRRVRFGGSRAATGSPRSRWFSREQGACWISFLVAALLMLRTLTNALGNPEWFSQTFDNGFHLNVIRWIQDTGDASSLHVTEMTAGGTGATFYPAAWHDVVSLVFATGADSIPAATSAMVLLTGAVLWPLSMLFLLRSMLRLNAPALLAAAPIMTGFTAFPLLLVYFGVLYPNFLGLSLLPAGLGIVLNLFRLAGARRLDTAQSVLLGVPVALGVSLAHPNAIMSLLVMMVPILVVRALLQVRAALRRTTAPGLAVVQVLLIAGILWFVWYLWGIVRPEAGAATWEPAISESQAFGEALLNSPLSRSYAQWSVSVLTVLGVVAAFRLRTCRWLVLTYAVVVYYYVAVRYLTWDQDRMWVTGVWYNDPYRLAALLPLAAIPLSVLAVHWLTGALLAWEPVRRRVARPSSATAPSPAEATSPEIAETSGTRSRRAGALVGAGTLVLGIALTQFSHPLTQLTEDSYWLHYAGEDAPLVNADELDVIEHLDQYVPEDATVVVNPWNGGSLAYALADRKTTAQHTLYTKTADDDVLDGYLNEARTDPRVCEVVDKEDARWVLDFGDQEINYGYHLGAYQGLQDLEESGVARTVYASGDAKLLKVTACD